jgi:hypothetical protein
MRADLSPNKPKKKQEARAHGQIVPILILHFGVNGKGVSGCFVSIPFRCNTNFQAISSDSFSATLVAKEMPLRADVIKGFIKERLVKEQDTSVDIINQKKYVLELVDVDLVDEINDGIDKRLRLTVSDIVDVILARLIVNTANSLNTTQNI